MIEVQPASERLGQRIFRPALIVGVLGLALSVVGGFFDPDQAFRSYLMGYVLWLDLPLGCLALSLIQFMTGGAWGLAIRRIVEAGARTMPLMALLFIPIFFGLPQIYIWARPEVVAQDPLLQHKSLYLNSAGYIIRALVYFVAWCGLVYYLGRWSTDQDQSADPRLLGKLQRLSIGGGVLLGFTASFAMIDWLMSLEPDWYSTAYAAWVAWGAVLTSTCFAIVMLVLLGRRPPLARVISPQVLNDLGSLLLAFLILWSYIGYFQYLLIWAGNLNEEIPWFLKRAHGEWQPIGVVVVMGTFALPFLLLLFRGLKRQPRSLATIAWILLITRPIDTFWLVKPAFVTEGWLLHWLDVAAAVGLGGIWLAAFTWSLAQRPLLPPNDQRLPAAIGTVHGRA